VNACEYLARIGFDALLGDSPTEPLYDEPESLAAAITAYDEALYAAAVLLLDAPSGSVGRADIAWMVDYLHRACSQADEARCYFALCQHYGVEPGRVYEMPED
jgi:hypothetical protein